MLNNVILNLFNKGSYGHKQKHIYKIYNIIKIMCVEYCDLGINFSRITVVCALMNMVFIFEQRRFRV